jgi:thioredoxin reductase (NADPH)
MFLTKYASQVYLIHRRDELRASKTMADRALANPKIKPLWNKVPVSVTGENGLMTKVLLEDTKTKEKSELPANGFFYAIGHTPNTALFKGFLNLHDNGYLKVKEGSTKTNIEGVFACGDAVDFKYRQAVTAAGYLALFAYFFEGY